MTDNILKLFKYKKDSQHTIDMLQSREIYFSFPSEFNDPYDCKIVMHLEGSDEEIRSWLGRPEVDPAYKRLMYSKLRTTSDKSEIIRSQREKMAKVLALYCLSEVNDNLLMWSHYANGHAGICIGIKTVIYDDSVCIKFEDPILQRISVIYINGLIPVYKVRYSDVRPDPYSILKGQSKDLEPFLLSKSNDWAYEKERRIMIPYPALSTKLLRIDKAAIAEVYMGANINENYRNKVIEILKKEYWDKKFDVKVYQMRCPDSRYKLETVRLSI